MEKFERFKYLFRCHRLLEDIKGNNEFDKVISNSGDSLVVDFKLKGNPNKRARFTVRENGYMVSTDHCIEFFINSKDAISYAINKQIGNNKLKDVNNTILDMAIECFDMLSDTERVIVMDGYCKRCGIKIDSKICICNKF